MKSADKRSILQQQGWLRVLIFCVVYSLLLLGVWYGLSRRVTGSAVNALMLFVLSVVCVFVFRRWLDRKSFVSLGLRFDRIGFGGIFLALFILSAGTLLLHYSGHLSWLDILPDGPALGIAFGSMLFVAIGEETVFRGYILQNLLGSINPWLAILIQAFLFGIFHLGSPGIGLIPLVNLFLGGALLGLACFYTKNLWFPILFHFGWDFFQGPVLGFHVSGQSTGSLLQPEFRGEEMLTGGSFGFEGSLFATAFLLLAGVLLYLVMEGKLQWPKRSLPVPNRK